MPRVNVCPSQAGPAVFDVFINGYLYRSSLPYIQAMTLAQQLRSQAVGAVTASR